SRAARLLEWRARRTRSCSDRQVRRRRCSQAARPCGGGTRQWAADRAATPLTPGLLLRSQVTSCGVSRGFVRRTLATKKRKIEANNIFVPSYFVAAFPQPRT